MNLLDVVRRAAEPAPWAEGDNIPWHEPAFSKRMLAEHLCQSHDAASRREQRIERHVQWIHADLLGGRATRILDLGCGPGLYTSRLAGMGHDCVGIDYSPASIEYASGRAAEEGLACRYVQADLREAAFGSGFGLVMLIYGELNVFRPDDAEAILAKAFAALEPGGMILLEAHTEAIVEKMGNEARGWYSAAAGLFSDQPHLCLQENSWQSANRTATTRYFIIDAATGQVTRHAASYQAYSDDEYRSMLTARGFRDVRLLPSLAGDEDEGQAGLVVIVARK